jgi:hypothetical protein
VAEEALMDTLIREPEVETPPPQERSSADNLRAQVWNVLGALYPGGNRIERRGGRRYPYPYLVRLTPVAEDGVTPEGEPVVVVGKHLSENGLGFYHPKPLPYRRVIAALETSCGTWLRFLVDVTWCRFRKQGWYESGGRFLQAAPAEQASVG